MRGGFLRRNKQDAAAPYYPYYLTEAGSVFVLKIKNETKAVELFDLWEKRGLDLPKWAEDSYGKPVWRQCPFVPENGYGEVMINLTTIEAKEHTEGVEK